MLKPLLLCCLLPGVALAQTTRLKSLPAVSWEYGLGLGNGTAIQIAHFRHQLIALGRVRGKWWRAANAPGSSVFGDPETRSRQAEVAALVGYPMAVGGSRFYAAAGLGYVDGSQAGEYRYTVRTSGLLSDPNNFYAHHQYQALGLPLEAGWQSPGLGAEKVRVGLAGQANLNPQQAVFCLLATVWFSGGNAHPIPKP